MNLTLIAEKMGILLFEDSHPHQVPDALGKIGASPYAQACSRGVAVISLEDPVVCYSVCHEIAHLLEGYSNERKVFQRQKELALMLDEPGRSKAMPASGDLGEN